MSAFCSPWFHVRFDDGDAADFAGHELARYIVFREADFYNPRLWYYGFSIMNPADVPGWRMACSAFGNNFGLELPTLWLNSAGTEDTGHDAAEESTAAFLKRERASLQVALSDMLGQAREKRTILNLRNPGLKLLWWCASRGCNFPPTANDMALYCTKLATDQDNIGAVSVAKNALSFICAYNDLPTDTYTSLRTNAALEAMRRKHKHQTKKAAGLTVNMVKAIMEAFGFERPKRPAHRQ